MNGPPDLPLQVNRVVPLQPPGWALFIETDPTDTHLIVRLVTGEGHHQEIVAWFKQMPDDEDDQTAGKWDLQTAVWPDIVAHITHHVVTGTPPSDDLCRWGWP